MLIFHHYVLKPADVHGSLDKPEAMSLKEWIGMHVYQTATVIKNCVPRVTTNEPFQALTSHSSFESQRVETFETGNLYVTVARNHGNHNGGPVHGSLRVSMELLEVPIMIPSCVKERDT